MAAGLVDAALADIASLPSLLTAQESAGLQRGTCLANVFTAWAARLQVLPAMSADDKTNLTMAWPLREHLSRESIAQTSRRW